MYTEKKKQIWRPEQFIFIQFNIKLICYYNIGEKTSLA